MSARKARFTLDLDPQLHARLKLVAARNRTSMRSYSIEALELKLAGEPEEFLSALEAPVFAELWDNAEDAAYDQL